MLAIQRAEDGVDDGVGGSATGAEVGALKASLAKETRLRVKVEDEHKELQKDLDDVYAEQSKAMLEDRRMKELMSEVRKSFLEARLEYGFRFPVRQMGELDDRTRQQEKGKFLPACVKLEGKLGISELQSFVNDVKWHPTRVISSGTGDDTKSVSEINWDDKRLRAIEKRYPSQVRPRNDALRQHTELPRSDWLYISLTDRCV